MNEHINVTNHEIEIKGLLVIVDFSYDLTASEGFQDLSFPNCGWVEEYINHQFDIIDIYSNGGEEVTEDFLSNLEPNYKNIILTELIEYRQ